MATPVNASSSSAGPIWGSDASVSSDRCFRWWLTRRWQHGGRVLIFLGLNPSRADTERDDPTLRRLLGFAGDWGYDALAVVNLFARMSPSPSVLRRCQTPLVGTPTLRCCIGATRGRTRRPGPSGVAGAMVGDSSAGPKTSWIC